MRRRILVSYISLTLFVLVVLEIPLGLYFADRERERFTNGALSDAMVLATLFEDHLDQGAPLDPRSATDYAERTGARVLLVDASGVSKVDTTAAVGRDFSSRPEIAEALSGQRASGERRSESLDEDLLYVAVPVASGGDVHGALRVTLPVSELDERIHRFWWGLAGIGVLTLTAVTGIGWAVAGSMTSPVRALQGTARAFGEGDLAPRPAPERAPAELRELSDSLNAMAERLRTLIDSQRSFVADASHQLRTPLTALRLRLENLEGGTGAERQADVDAATAEIARLSLLVEQLLHLARADQTGPPEPVETTRVVADRVDTWGAVSEAAGVILRADLPGSAVTARLAPGTLEQILDNLIDNAINASAPGDAVEVRLRAEPAGLGLTVTDHGPGLPDADKARALDRFWRGSAEAAGTGLGLPIVASLVRAHGGSLRLVDTPGGGLTVAIRLPAAAARG